MKKDLRVPYRAELARTLDDLDGTWPGPFGERAHLALRSAAADLRRALRVFDELAAKASGAERVVTHGEPHPGNVMRSGAELRLVDWDTVALAPRERDLTVAMPRDDDEWAAYRSAGAPGEADPHLVRLYRLQWSLAEVSLYARWFRGTHDDDADARTAWEGFSKELEMIAEADG